MPLLRFDVIEGRSEAEITKLLDAAHEAVVKALNVPVRDRYQVVHQHPAHELIVQDTGLGIERSKDLVLISIVSVGRSDELKQALYKALADELERQCGVARTDVMISLTPTTKSDWSFGFGEAQFLTGKLSARHSGRITQSNVQECIEAPRIARKETLMSYATINPYNERTLKTFSEHDDAHVEETIGRAHSVYSLDWSRRPIEHRKAIVKKAAAILRERREKLAEL